MGMIINPYRHATAGGTGYILDDITTNILGAWSVRKIRQDYTGAPLRIKRSSDGTEQDLPFSGDDLDHTDSFLDASNYTMTKWYAQHSGAVANDDMTPYGADTGNTNDNPSFHPAASGGSYLADANSGGNRAGLKTTTTFTAQYYQICVVGRYVTRANNSYLFQFSASTAAHRCRNINTDDVEFYNGSTITKVNGFVNGSDFQRTFISESGSTDEVFLNGISEVAGQIGDTSRASAPFHAMHDRTTSATTLWSGRLMEIILMDGGFNGSDQTDIESDQSSYFGTP